MSKATLTQEIDYNDPLVLVEIFRIPEGDGSMREYNTNTAILWEDIVMIDRYAFEDNWNQNKGEKYHLHLRHQPNAKLILGNFDSILNHWTIFRRSYPLFTNRDEDNGMG